MGTIHIVEMIGHGGIYQHSVAVAAALQSTGAEVVLHTAEDHETTPSAVPTCTCMKWTRRAPNGLRQPITATRFLLRTVPHMALTARRGDVVHLQGTFGHSLSLILLKSVTRAIRVITPHNSFVRSGRKRHERTLRRIVRAADLVVATVDADLARFRAWNPNVIRHELIHDLAPPTAAAVSQWRQAYGDRPVALLAGQVRADKRPDVFIEACALAAVTPAVVGPRSDGEGLLEAAQTRLGVEVLRFPTFLPLEQFIAATLAADVVVATHSAASGSGPLAFAQELGCRSVAVPVGGLAEQASTVARGMSARDVANAITESLSGARPEPLPLARGVAEQLEDAYAQLGWAI